jgi:peptidoglycan/LPS O-acetylase OafA/YrhL
VAAVGLVAWIAAGCRVPSWLVSPWLLFFGQISYGLYLWHEVLIDVIGQELGLSGVRGVATGTASAFLAIPIAVLSYRFVEQPFLQRKARFERVAMAA